MGKIRIHKPLPILAILWSMTSIVLANDDPLGRRGYWGATLREPGGGKAGAVVARIQKGTPAAAADLAPGDRILRINGQLLSDPITYSVVTGRLRAGETVRLEVLREGRLLETEITLTPYPKEKLEGVDVLHDLVVTDHGHALRTIVTRPRQGQGPWPAVMFVAWLSCDSVEWPFEEGADGWAQLLHRLATKSGYVTLRMDKPGVGDSGGPPCAGTDFHTELAGYRAAWKALTQYDFVDAGKIFIFGGSMGGAMAPILAQDVSSRGVVVWGTYAKTWFEHMMEHERRRLALAGLSSSDIHERMKGYAEFYTEYLARKLTPAEVIRKRPHLAPLWYDEPGHQYGRPAAFYHQAQDVNLAAAWEKIDVPVLSIYGEYDWIMSRDDHELIAEIVNHRHPGNARFVLYPKMDHGFLVHESLQASFDGSSEGRFDEGILDLILGWMRQVLSGGPGGGK